MMSEELFLAIGLIIMDVLILLTIFTGSNYFIVVATFVPAICFVSTQKYEGVEE